MEGDLNLNIKLDLTYNNITNLNISLQTNLLVNNEIITEINNYSPSNYKNYFITLFKQVDDFHNYVLENLTIKLDYLDNNGVKTNNEYNFISDSGISVNYLNGNYLIKGETGLVLIK